MTFRLDVSTESPSVIDRVVLFPPAVEKSRIGVEIGQDKYKRQVWPLHLCVDGGCYLMQVGAIHGEFLLTDLGRNRALRINATLNDYHDSLY